MSPLDDPVAMRRAGRDLLSLALIDARNHLLGLLAQDESPAALQRSAHAGWFQEYWIARHVQRQRGEACDPRATRLAGIEPHADAWACGDETPRPDALRSYLAETLEITLDLLAGSAEDDAALHFFRLSLLHEDRLCEALAEAMRVGAPPARAVREPIWLPAQRWWLGSAHGGHTQEGSPPCGLVPHNERWAHEVAVPESEIDAQPVNWGQFVEFAEDRGYERREFWSDAGWLWLQAGGRRAPGQVEQLLGGVLVQRQGGLQRAPALQPVMHANRHEAEAWCRWAGRRLPTEAEWELAAGTAARRGFVWGDVFEWVAGSARAWPGAGGPAPGMLDAMPPAGMQGVLRGASFATRLRWHHPQARRFARPERDAMFCGFRSCAL
ncbi:MAG: SUMF1/EgtB/PvdO family nonheme iron enzyme [Rubrivivax sp.]|nr:SUMF1/EgtB/PvdO family nonheme iron enzyme [Rubrivivax sp.]